METRYTSDVAQLYRYARPFFEKQFRLREKSNRPAIPVPIVRYCHQVAREVARFFSALTARRAFPFGRSLPFSTAATTCGVVRIGCQLMHICKKCRRLADEETHVCQELHYPHGNALRLGRPNDRTNREA